MLDSFRAVWLCLVVNDRKFPVITVFFSHTNQPAVLLHEPATIRTSQPNRLSEQIYDRLVRHSTIGEREQRSPTPATRSRQGS